MPIAARGHSDLDGYRGRKGVPSLYAPANSLTAVYYREPSHMDLSALSRRSLEGTDPAELGAEVREPRDRVRESKLDASLQDDGFQQEGALLVGGKESYWHTLASWSSRFRAGFPPYCSERQ